MQLIDSKVKVGKTSYGAVRKMQTVTTLCRLQCGEVYVRALPSAVFTSAKEVMFSSLFVCLSVCLYVGNFAKQTSERICMKFSVKTGNGPMNRWSNFGGDPDEGSGSGSVSRHW